MCPNLLTFAMLSWHSWVGDRAAVVRLMGDTTGCPTPTRAAGFAAAACLPPPSSSTPPVMDDFNAAACVCVCVQRSVLAQFVFL